MRDAVERFRVGDGYRLAGVTLGVAADAPKGSDPVWRRQVSSAAVPIHLRANEGDYAPAVLLPGDPLRAQRIARDFLDDAKQVNGERGMLGYTGTFEGRPVSVQSTGMGCPSAAIVIEELITLGATRLIRVGTCGGLQPQLELGDLVVALSAVPGDSTALRYTGGEAHAPTANFNVTHGLIHSAKELKLRPHVGPIASSDTFYDPDPDRHRRWAARGCWPSRWRPRCCSRSARCAASRRPAC